MCDSRCLLLRYTGQLKCDGTRAETRFRLSAKWTSPFTLVGALVQSTTGSRGVCNSGTPCSEVVWRALATHSIRQFPLHFSRVSPCAIRFQLESNLAIPTTLYRSSKELLFIPKTKYVKRVYWYNDSWSHEDVNKANFWIRNRVTKFVQHIDFPTPFNSKKHFEWVENAEDENLQNVGRLLLKCDGTRAETTFRISAKRTSPFKSAEGVSSVDNWQPSCTHQQ